MFRRIPDSSGDMCHFGASIPRAFPRLRWDGNLFAFSILGYMITDVTRRVFEGADTMDRAFESLMMTDAVDLAFENLMMMDAADHAFESLLIANTIHLAREMWMTFPISLALILWIVLTISDTLYPSHSSLQ
jgi:hypothetical protein